MKKVMGKVKRALSIMLAVAMVVTMLPQTALSAYAEELDPASVQAEDEAVDDQAVAGATETADMAPGAGDGEEAPDAAPESNDGEEAPDAAPGAGDGEETLDVTPKTDADEKPTDPAIEDPAEDPADNELAEALAESDKEGEGEVEALEDPEEEYEILLRLWTNINDGSGEYDDDPATEENEGEIDNGLEVTIGDIRYKRTDDNGNEVEGIKEISTTVGIKRDGESSLTLSVKPGEGYVIGAVRMGADDGDRLFGIDLDGKPSQEKPGCTDYILGQEELANYLENGHYDGDSKIVIWVETRHVWDIEHGLDITLDGTYIDASIYEITDYNGSGEYVVGAENQVYGGGRGSVTITEDEAAYFAIVAEDRDAESYKAKRIYTYTNDAYGDGDEDNYIPVGEDLGYGTITIDGSSKSARFIKLIQPGGMGDNVSPIYIDLADLTELTYSIAFHYDESKVEKPVIKVDGELLADKEWSGNTATIPGIHENVTFTVDAKAGSKHKIGTVTVEGEKFGSKALEAGDDGVYDFGQVTEDITVKIGTDIDEGAANKLALKVEGSTNADAFTAKFRALEGESLDEGFEEDKVYKSGDTIKTLLDSFYVIFMPADRYKLGRLSFDKDIADVSEVTEKNDPGAYDALDLVRGQKAYKVTFNAPGDAEELTLGMTAQYMTRVITFANSSANLKYAVKTSKELISPKPGATNAFETKEGAEGKSLVFEVTANNGYVPVVSYDPEGEDKIAGNDTPGNKTTVYTYTIENISALSDDTVIYIAEKPAPQVVKVTFDTDMVEIAPVRIGAKTFDKSPENGWSSTKSEKEEDKDKNVFTETFAVPHGETITLTVAAYKYSQLTKVTQTTTTASGTTNKTLLSKNAASYEISIKADYSKGDIQIDVTSEDIYKAELKRRIGENLSEVPVDKNGYTVEYGYTYRTWVRHGIGSAQFTEAGVQVLDGKNPVTSGVNINYENDRTTADITLDSNAFDGKAKKLTVGLYVVDGPKDKDSKPVAAATYTLNVLPMATGVSVTGAKKVSGVTTITQAMNTTKRYPVKVTPNTASLGRLSAKLVDAAGQDYNSSKAEARMTGGGELEITTHQAIEGSENVKVRFSYAGVPKDEFDILLVSEKQLESVKPTLKLASSDDTTLTLTLGAPKAVVDAYKDAVDSNVYYAVTIESAGAAKTTDETKVEEIKGKVKEALNQNKADGEPYYKTFYTLFNGELTQSTPYTVYGNGMDRGNGAAWKYNVTVQLVQAKGEVLDGTALAKDAILSESLPIDQGKNPYETKNPYYEDALKLTKGTTTIYTGQEVDPKNSDGFGVLIATAKFGANTTYAKITHAVDITYDDITKYDVHGDDSSVGENGALQLKVYNNKVYAVANYSSDFDKNGRYTTVGKHKVIVYAEADKNAQPSTATIDITVVQGIEELAVTVPSTSIYKVDKKASTLKATAVYAVAPKAPKTKKVDWEIVGVGENAAPAGVTVKNGTITVDKSYVVSSDEKKNQFRVKATAADYTGNKEDEGRRCALSDVITITDQAQPIGEVALVTLLEDGNYAVVARNNASLTEEYLRRYGKYYVKVLRKGTPEVEVISEDKVLESSCFTFTSSNKAAVAINADGSVTVNKPAKNVKITATANDGSKQKSILTFTVNYAATAEKGVGALGLKITAKSSVWVDNADQYPDRNGTLNYRGTAGTVVDVQVVRDANPYDPNYDEAGWDGWEDLSDYTDFKVTASNAKIFKIDAGYVYGDHIQLMTTKLNASVTLTYSYVEQVNGKDKTYKKTIKYDLINSGFGTDKAKAPKFATSGSLIANEYEQAQALTYTVTGLKDAEELKKDKQLRIEADMSSANAKTLDAYQTLSNHLSDEWGNPRVIGIGRDGIVRLEFKKLDLSKAGEHDGKGEWKSTTNIPAGSYKIKLTVGRIDHTDAPYEFVPEYQAATVTVKVTAPKAVKGSFKLTTGYSLSMADSQIEFVYSGSDIKGVTFKENTLSNANVKGKDNKFLEYFEYFEKSVDGNKVSGIRLKNEVVDALMEKQKVTPAATLKDVIPDKDLTGYIVYSAAYGTTVDRNVATKVTDTAKITVKLVTANNGTGLKYAASGVTVLADRNNVKADIAITAGGKKKAIARAYSVDSKNNPGFATPTPIGESDIKDNVVTLTSSGQPKVTGHKPTLYVMPEGSAAAYYISQLEKVGKSIETAFTTYGVKLAPTITVKDPKSMTGKIKVANTNLTLENGSFDTEYKTYVTWVQYYTTTATCDILMDHDEENPNGGGSTYVRGMEATGVFANKMYFSKGTVPIYDDKTGETTTVSCINAWISKADLKAVVGDAKAKVAYGKTYTVPVKVKFAGAEGATATEYKEETVSFKVKLPNAASDKLFTTISKEISENRETIMNVSRPSDSDWDEIKARGELGECLNDIKYGVIKNLREYVPGDGNAALEYSYERPTRDNCPNVKYKAATADKAGSITVTLKLVDLSSGNENKDGTWTYDKRETLTFEFPIAKTNDLGTIAEKVRTAIGNMVFTNEHNNNAAIRTFIREDKEVKKALGKSVMLYTRDFWIEEATEDTPGKITLTVTIEDIAYGGSREWHYNDGDGDDDYECLMISAGKSTERVEGLKKAMDDAINDSVLALNEFISKKDVEGSPKVKYDAGKKAFTIEVDENSDDTVKDAYAKWSGKWSEYDREQGYEKAKKRIIDIAEIYFTDDYESGEWNKIEEVTLEASVTNELLAKKWKDSEGTLSRSKTVVKGPKDKSEEEIERFAKELAEKYIGLYEGKVASLMEDIPSFVEVKELAGTTGEVTITVKFKDEYADHNVAAQTYTFIVVATDFSDAE